MSLLQLTWRALLASSLTPHELLAAAGSVPGPLLSLPSLQQILAVWGYPAVVLCMLIESGASPSPSETMLLLAALTAGLPGSRLAFGWVIAACAVDAIVGIIWAISLDAMACVYWRSGLATTSS